MPLMKIFEGRLEGFRNSKEMMDGNKELREVERK
jgi:hypothetical protein